MAVRNGKQAILAQFALDGLHHMFGNPGTVEQGFLDALDDYPEIKYILTLHETVAVMAADGYARSTQKPTLVQLHSSPGIGNAVGALYQAKRGHAPLVVIGGDAGLKYMNMDAQMAGDLVAMMEPVTKYATMVLDSKSLLRTVRRAIKIAATPPMGPVSLRLALTFRSFHAPPTRLSCCYLKSTTALNRCKSSHSIRVKTAPSSSGTFLWKGSNRVCITPIVLMAHKTPIKGCALTRAKCC